MKRVGHRAHRRVSLTADRSDAVLPAADKEWQKMITKSARLLKTT